MASVDAGLLPDADRHALAHGDAFSDHRRADRPDDAAAGRLHGRAPTRAVPPGSSATAGRSTDPAMPPADRSSRAGSAVRRAAPPAPDARRRDATDRPTDAPPRETRFDRPAPAAGTSFASLPLRWAFAAFAGLAATAFLPHLLPERGLPPALEADGARTLLGLLGGWCTVAVLAPWGSAGRLRELHEAIEHLTESVRRSASADPDRRRPLPRVPERTVDRLREAIEEAIRVASAARRHARYLEKSIPKSVEQASRTVERRFRAELETDPLTGVGNRRRLDAAIERIFAPGRPRREDVVAALVIDLDRFKQVNDRLGHEAGDEVLVHLGRVLQACVRSADVAVRTGGDEFVLLLPGLAAGPARRVAERIRAEFRRLPWPHAGVERPSLSMGIAVAALASATASSAEALLRDADEAAYAAKHAGRDAIHVHGDRSGPLAAAG